MALLLPLGLIHARHGVTTVPRTLVIAAAEGTMRANWDEDDDWMAERAEWIYVPVRPKVAPIRRRGKHQLKGLLLAFLANMAILALLGQITVMLVKWIP
jgi:uncharacterized protein YggT (Ycf19 family)